MPRTFNIANATTPACSESEFDLLMHRLNICEYLSAYQLPKQCSSKLLTSFFPLVLVWLYNNDLSDKSITISKLLHEQNSKAIPNY